MQIRAVSELENLGVVYKDALHMPDSLNHEGIYIETSYKNGANYDSKKIDLRNVLNCLYKSINALCSEVTTLRAKVNNDNHALSANGTNQGITGYNKLINEFKASNATEHSSMRSDYDSKINAVKQDIGKNYLNINSTGTQRIKGPLTFDSNLSGKITNALTADCAKWN